MSYPRIRRGGGAAPTGKCYRLEADLNLSAWDDTAIGGRTKEAPFTGHFDGNGHTLTYRVQGGALSGLFPYVGAAEADQAVIRNLHCSVTQTAVEENAEDTVSYGALIRSAQNCEISGITVSQTFEGRAERAAGIAGELLADGVIEDCAVASAAGKYYTYGGVVKMLYGKVEGCRYALGEGASELERFGGICEGMYGTVDSCNVSFPAEGVKAVVTETIMGTNGGRVGGIASSVGAGTVCDCRVVFNLSEQGDAPYLGGIAGWLDVNRNAITEEGVSIRDCRVTGAAIRGGTLVGGVAGYFQRTLGYRYEISGIEVEVGSIECTGDYVGGLFGRVIADGDTTVADCSVTADVNAAGRMAGGFIGNLAYSKLEERETSRFAMRNCHMYGASVAAQGNGDTAAYAGGAIGHIASVAADANYCRTDISDCNSFAQVNARGNIGGFIGSIISREIPLSSTEYQIQNCFAYGNATAAAGSQSGGFIGFVDSTYLRIADCKAYGSAAVSRGAAGAGGTHAGGFIGFANTIDAVERCEAFGDAEGGGGIAGFIGRLNAGTVKNCKSWGNVLGWWDTGGFVGWLATASTHENNEAHGNVVAGQSNRYGGYAGALFDVAGMDRNFYAKNCTAYGNVTDASDSGYSVLGGFVGLIMTSVKAELVGCKAYGSVRGADSGGGFVGSIEAILASAQISFTDCDAYGDASATYVATSQAAGFAAIIGWGNDFGTVNFTGCKAYGSVVGRDEAGGLLGLVASKVIMTGCGYYGPSLVNDAVYSEWRGGLVAQFLPKGGTFEGSILTDNEFTFINRTVGVAKAGIAYTDSNNKYLGAVPVNPKGMIAVAFSGAGNTFTVAFTNAAGFKVTELAVSADGGKYYTQLVHSGKALVTLTPQAAGQNPLSCQNFSYTYSMVSPGAVRVRITVTNGTDTVTMVF